MTNVGAERLRGYTRLALALAVALGLSALALLASPDSARADHICTLNPATSFGVGEGGTVTLDANSTNCHTINWDLDNDGFYDDGSGETITFAAGERDGPGSQIVGIEGFRLDRICELDPETNQRTCRFEPDYAYAQTTVNIFNVGPTATLNAPTTAVTTGTTFTISLTGATDPSSADRSAGFTYAFDCDGDGIFERGMITTSTSVAVSCTANNGLSQTVRGRLTDKDGAVSTTYQRTVTLNDTTAPTVLDEAAYLEPDRGAVGVSRTTNVSATFSEAMKSDTLTSTTFKLQMYNKKTKKWKTIPATLSLSNGNKTATLDPYGATEQLLAANKKFRGFITTGAQDLAGNPLARNFIWTFTTGG